MKHWRGLLFVGVFILTTWLVVGARRPQELSCQNRLDPTALSGEYDPLERLAFFEDRRIPVPPPSEDGELAGAVLGTTDAAKRIEIDLARQRVYAFEEDRKVYDFVISSGKPWWPTTTGEFRIWIKLRSSKMEGGSKDLGTYYYLPNVPYIMYFFNDQVPKWRGYGIHGAYWHDNFGNTMSHGCVNLRPDDAGLLFHWTESLETPVVIYGKEPAG